MRRMRHLKPREIQGCDIAFQFWRPETLYDATSGGSLVASGGSIARAEDVSGNGNHATQGTSGDRPVRQVNAQNGLDAARFDGSSDYLNAGDVADMRDKPVEAYACFIRTGSAGAKGIFGKGRAANAAGRWSILNNAPADTAIAHDASGVTADFAQSASLQVLYFSFTRSGSNSLTLRRNESTTTTANPLVGSTDHNTTDVLMIGAYQNASGTPSLSSSFIGADIIECAKWSRLIGDVTRKRAQHAAMRRARIAG